MSLNQKLDILSETIANKLLKDIHVKTLSLENCINFCKEACEIFPQAKEITAGFVISVQKNVNAKNQCDNFTVIQGLIDKNHKPIAADEKNGISRIIHAETIDLELISFLNGATTKLYLFN